MKSTKLENYLNFNNLRSTMRGIFILFNDIIGVLFSHFNVNYSNYSNYCIAIITNQDDFIFINLKDKKVLRILSDNLNIHSYIKKRKIFSNSINSVSCRLVSNDKTQLIEPFITGKYFSTLSKNLKIKLLKKMFNNYENYINKNKIYENSEILQLKKNLFKLLKLIYLDKSIKVIFEKIDCNNIINNMEFIVSHKDLSSRNIMYYKNELIVIDFPSIDYYPIFYDPLSLIFLNDNEMFDEFVENKFENEIIKILKFIDISKESIKLQISKIILIYIIFHAYRKVTQKLEDNINFNEFKKYITLGLEKWYLPYLNKNNLKV